MDMQSAIFIRILSAFFNISINLALFGWILECLKGKPSHERTVLNGCDKQHRVWIPHS